MKSLLHAFIIVTLITGLAGCKTNAQQEAVDAIRNLNNEAVRVQEQAKTTWGNFNEAKASVDQAVKAVQDAKGKIEELTP